MTNTKHTGPVIFILVVIAALYLSWTALNSSRCLSEGIEHQTRTTWSPAEGCTAVDSYKKPWSVFPPER